MYEGDIVETYCSKFKVYNCRFLSPYQLEFCKIYKNNIFLPT